MSLSPEQSSTTHANTNLRLLFEKLANINVTPRNVVHAETKT